MRRSQVLTSLAIGVINLAIFYFLVKWLVENIQVAILLEQFRRIPPTVLLPPLALNILALACYALRLRTLMRTPFSVSFYLVNLGSGLNAILPFRMGELAKLYFAKKIYFLSAAQFFSAGVVEKCCDLIAIGVLVIVVAMGSQANFIDGRLAAFLFGLVFVTYVAVLLFRKYSHYVERRLSRLIRLQIMIASLREFSRVNQVLHISAATLAIWVVNVGVVYVAFTGFLPSIEFGVIDAISILVIVALAVAIPSAPAGLGVFEAGVAAYLIQALHVEKEAALACAIVFHIVITVPQIVITVWTLGVGLAKKPAGCKEN